MFKHAHARIARNELFIVIDNVALKYFLRSSRSLLFVVFELFTTNGTIANDQNNLLFYNCEKSAIATITKTRNRRENCIYSRHCCFCHLQLHAPRFCCWFVSNYRRLKSQIMNVRRENWEKRYFTLHESVWHCNSSYKLHQNVGLEQFKYKSSRFKNT